MAHALALQPHNSPQGGAGAALGRPMISPGAAAALAAEAGRLWLGKDMLRRYIRIAVLRDKYCAAKVAVAEWWLRRFCFDFSYDHGSKRDQGLVPGVRNNAGTGASFCSSRINGVQTNILRKSSKHVVKHRLWYARNSFHYNEGSAQWYEGKVRHGAQRNLKCTVNQTERTALTN